MTIKRKEVIGDCTLYLADCADVLEVIGEVGDLCTDPPYGINASGGVGKYGRQKFAKADKGWDKNTPEAALFRQIMEMTDRQVIWGGNYFDLPPTRGYLVWDKGAGFKGRDFAECEYAWTSLDMNARVLSYDPLARGDYRDKRHPTQKPVTVMTWCIGFLSGEKPIFDPFMGSGTTGVACASRGRRFVGVEIDEGYFDVACDRIRTAYLQADMFAAAKPAPEREVWEQASMFAGDQKA